MTFKTTPVLRAALAVRFSIPLAVALAAATAAHAESVMTRHMRAEVSTGAAQPAAQLPQAQGMSLDIVLPLRDPAGLTSFLADIYNPASPNFHHFVTPAQFTAKFGPTQRPRTESHRKRW